MNLPRGITVWRWIVIVLAVASSAWMIRWSQSPPSCPPKHYCMVVVCPDGYRCVTHWQFGQSVLVEHSVTVTPPTGGMGIKGQ